MSELTFHESSIPGAGCEVLVGGLTVGEIKLLPACGDYLPERYHAVLFPFGKDGETPTSVMNLAQGYGATRQEAIRDALHQTRVDYEQYLRALATLSDRILPLIGAES